MKKTLLLASVLLAVLVNGCKTEEVKVTNLPSCPSSPTTTTAIPTPVPPPPQVIQAQQPQLVAVVQSTQQQTPSWQQIVNGPVLPGVACTSSPDDYRQTQTPSTQTTTVVYVVQPQAPAPVAPVATTFVYRPLYTPPDGYTPPLQQPVAYVPAPAPVQTYYVQSGYQGGCGYQTPRIGLNFGFIFGNGGGHRYYTPTYYPSPGFGGGHGGYYHR